MNKVTKLLLVASVAAIGLGGFSACSDSVTVVEPPPTDPPVIPPPPGTEARIEISSITNTTGTVINPAAVAGQINVILNVEPGTDNVLNKVAIQLDGEEVASQTFGAAASKSGNGPGISASAAPTQIILAYNTAEIVNGAARWLNTSHDLTATMNTAAGDAGAAKQTLTFTNINVSAALVFTGNSASDAAGNTWYGNDDIEVSLNPVVYSTTPPTVTFTTTGTCVFDDGSTAGDATSVATTVTKTGNDVVYSLDMTAAQNAIEDNGCVVTASALATVPKTMRLDNVAPVAPTNLDYTFMDGRNTAAVGVDPVNSWGNATTAFGLNGALLDGGIGTVVFTLNEAVPVGASFGTPASYSVGDVVEDGDDFDESASAAASAAVRIVTSELEDGLGNERTTGLGPSTTCVECSNWFWIDKTAPVFASIRPTGMSLRPASALVGPATDIDVITDFTVTEALSGIDMDAAGVGSTSFQTAIDVERNGTNAAFTLSPVPPDGAVVTNSAHDIVVAGSGTNAALEGSWTVDAQFVDQAGNVGLFPGTAMTIDITPPIVNLTIQQSNVTANGATTAAANYAGDFSDASGIASAMVTGYNGAPVGGTPPSCGGTVFVPADANIDIINLGTGPAFAFQYVLNTQGVGVTNTYCYHIQAFDPTVFIDGTAAGNPSAVAPGHSVTW